MRRDASLLVLLLFGLGGCTSSISLTANGRGVNEVPQPDLPATCRLIGDVPVGISPDAATPPSRDDLVVLMRNKAGELGGDHVVIDFAEERGEEPRIRWAGRGRAYNCRDRGSTVPEEEPATSGGDLGDEGASGDEASSGDSDSGGDSGISNEDLLNL